MKTPLLLIVVLTSITLIAKAVPTATDSLKVKQNLLDRRLDSLFAGLQKLTQTNDSLNKELYYYRAKDDFYVMAVDRQGSHFEWLLATVIGAAGLFSYTFLKRKLDKIKIEFKKSIAGQEAVLAALEVKASAISYNLKRQAATIHGRLAIISDSLTDEDEVPDLSSLGIVWEVLSWYLDAIEVVDYKDDDEVEFITKETSFYADQISKSISHFYSEGHAIKDKYKDAYVIPYLNEDQLNSFRERIVRIENNDLRKCLLTALFNTDRLLHDYTNYKNSIQ